MKLTGRFISGGSIGLLVAGAGASVPHLHPGGSQDLWDLPENDDHDERAAAGCTRRTDYLAEAALFAATDENRASHGNSGNA